MLDIIPSPILPRYAFDVNDEILIDGRQFLYFETRGNDHLFMPADGNGVVQGFNNSQIARWLEKGKFEHTPARMGMQDAAIPAQFLSLFSKMEKERAEIREALILAFLELHASGKGLCCTNRVRDSSCESSVVAGLHEQTDIPDLQD
ncbi:hypothetical protein CLV77_3108, partial [Brevirhabdus pacifica]